MSKSGLSLLFAVIGVVIGLLLGYAFFKDNTPKPAASTVQEHTAPHVDQFYYRINDSMMSRHTIAVSDSGLSHHVDTVALDRQ